MTAERSYDIKKLVIFEISKDEHANKNNKRVRIISVWDNQSKPL